MLYAHKQQKSLLDDLSLELWHLLWWEKFLAPGGWRNVMMVLELRSIPFGYSCAAPTVVHL